MGELTNTDRIMNDTFWVGVYPGMTDEMTDYMAKTIREALEQAGYKLDSAEISRIPQNTVAPDAAFYENIEKLLDMLEENDDIQNVYHNAEMDA